MPSVTYSQAVSQADDAPARRSRRALLQGAGALSLSLAARLAIRPATARAVLAVHVAAPRIDRTNDCWVSVSVDVTLAEVSSLTRYLLYGDILEADAGSDADEFCCTLRSQHALLTPGRSHSVTLAQRAMAVDLGLVRGLGPAATEKYSPDLVELFARVWLRDLETDEVLGPWNSPTRVAVSRALPGLMPSSSLRDNPLMTPRDPGLTITTSDGQPLPPLPCAP